MSIQISKVGHDHLVTELKVMSDGQLRALKIKFSEAKGGTLEHRIMTMCDRILRAKEGTYVGLL